MPGIAVENYWFRRHEAAYHAVRRLLPPSGRVLEAGIGEGYGAAMLAADGHRVVGLDYDPVTVRHVRQRYPAVPVARGNAVHLPFATGSQDAVVSMQLIEHLWDQPRHIAECARLLRPGGHLVVATPNRYTFSPGYDPATDRPRNLYHTREFSAAELTTLIGRFLPVRAVHGVRAGERLRALDATLRERYGADLVQAQLAGPAERWPTELHEHVGSVRAEDFDVTTADVDTSLDLLVVAVRG
ncbi:MAG: class I SAM-dependent methyltransferase [Actinocatenispora sp.]